MVTDPSRSPNNRAAFFQEEHRLFELLLIIADELSVWVTANEVRRSVVQLDDGGAGTGCVFRDHAALSTIHISLHSCGLVVCLRLVCALFVTLAVLFFSSSSGPPHDGDQPNSTRADKQIRRESERRANCAFHFNYT